MLLEMWNVTLVTTKPSITFIILCMIIEKFNSSENSHLIQTHVDNFLEFKKILFQDGLNSSAMIW